MGVSGEVNIAMQETKRQKQETDKKQTSSSYVGTLDGSTLLGHVRRLRVLALFGGSLLPAGFGLLLFLLPPLGHKPPPSLGDHFGPALGISGCVF